MTDYIRIHAFMHSQQGPYGYLALYTVYTRHHMYTLMLETIIHMFRGQQADYK